jgi:hypothetical protein
MVTPRTVSRIPAPVVLLLLLLLLLRSLLGPS